MTSSPAITKDEFIAAYAARSGVTVEWLLQRRHVVPCDCGDSACMGWALVPLDFRDA